MSSSSFGAVRALANSVRFVIAKSHCVLITSLITFSLSQPAFANVSTAGFTAGELSVSQSGAAIYSIPIIVSPGVAGMQPELLISYSSQDGDGLLGLGFNLSGLSTVQRCGATIEQDGFKGGVYYDSRDRFCLDGRRLIAVSGADGDSGTEYRTEIDAISKIISYGQKGSGPDYWIVKTKSGQTMEYGNTADSQVDTRDGQNAREWAVSKILDASANAIDFSYYEDTVNGEHYPLRLDYAQNSVRFSYEDRPVIRRHFQAGSKITLSKRMNSVAVYVGETLVRNYQLRYAADNILNRLEGVTEQSGTGDSFPETVFTWQTSTGSQFDQGSQWLPNLGNESLNALMDVNQDILSQYLDINGDGLPDRISEKNPTTGSPGLYVMLNNGSGFDSGSHWLPNYPLAWHNLPSDRDMYGSLVSAFRDINGDGLVDRVWPTDPTSTGFFSLIYGPYAALNNGAGFDASGTWHTPFSPNTPYYTNQFYQVETKIGDSNFIAFVDMNGDGKLDRVASRHPSGTYPNPMPGFYVMLRSENGLEPGQYWLPDYSGTDSNYVTKENAEDDVFIDQVDMNGDGLLDRVYNKNPITNAQGFYVMLNTGSGFDSGKQWLPDLGDDRKNLIKDYSGGDLQIAIFDINGDALPDRIFDRDPYTNAEGVHVMLNNGDGFEPVEKWIDDLGDISLSRVEEYVSDGSLKFGFVDVNGDGLPDRVYGENPYTGSKEIYVKLNTGNGFETGSTWIGGFSDDWKNQIRATNSEGDVKADFMDMNGDGLVDRVFSSNPNTNEQGLYVMLNQNYIPRVVNISSVMEDSSIEYSSIRDKSIYQNASEVSYPNINMPAPMGVVNQILVDNGVGGNNATTYKYGDGKFNVRGRGFLGFGWMEATDQQTSIVTKTTYRQDFPYTGQTLRTEQRLSDGTLIEETDIVFADITSYGDKVHFPYIASKVDASYELDGTSISTTTTQNCSGIVNLAT
ncbi:MAG: toxin TcdB middle/N-terminal domain-containing protein [Sedimenticola sp.]